MEHFLKAKHWQLFIFIFAIPFLVPFFVMGSILKDVVALHEPDPVSILQNFMYFPVIIIIYISVMYGWYWSVGVGLQNKVPSGVTLKVNRFKIFFFFPLFYLLVIGLIFFWIFTNIDNLFSSGPNPEDIYSWIGWVALIIPFHLFTVFCTFYIFFFCAKTIKTAQLQREVTFGDFVGEFFLIWFFPIGVWILQPEINKLVNEQEEG